MILISKIIANFVRAVLALLGVADEYIETSEVVVASIGSLNQYDKMIRPMPITNTYMIPQGIFFPVGNKFAIADVWNADTRKIAIQTTDDFNTWNKVSIPLYGALPRIIPRLLPAGAQPPFGYAQIQPIIDNGIIQGTPANSLLSANGIVGTVNDIQASYFTRYQNKATFLFRGRRIFLGKQYAYVANRWNSVDDLVSPGFFVVNNTAYQAYSAVEREIWLRRIAAPHPFAGLTVLNRVFPSTLTMNFFQNARTLAMTEDASGNIYSLHNIVFETSEYEPRVESTNYIYLCKNYVPVACKAVNMLDGGYSLSTRTYIHPTDYNGHWYKTYQNAMVGENGESSPQLAFKDYLYLSQYNKIYQIDSSTLETENIYEVPFCITQLSADANYLYAVHQGGVTVCNPQ